MNSYSKIIIFKKKSVLALLGLLIVLGLNAQQDPLFSQYMFNKLALNPAYAGSHDYFTTDILYRYQWVNIDGAPQTLNFSAHTPLRNSHIGLGLNIYQDVVGPTLSQGVLVTFAYRIIFQESKLAFGIQAGIKYRDIFWSQIKPYNLDDPIVWATVKNKVVPDANIGLYYYSKKYYIGISSKQLLQNEMSVVNVHGRSEYTKLIRHFYGMAGVSFRLSDDILIRPSILAKFVIHAPPQLDLNLSCILANNLLIGTSYRTEKAMSFMVEFNLTENLRLGYSYDIWFNELQHYNKGSHEMRLGYDLDIFQSKMLTPRYLL